MKRRRKVLWIIALVSLAVLGATVSYAWFYQHAALATLIDIVPPDSIKIVPIDNNGVDATMLDLDFNEHYGDKKDVETKRVTIYRPLYVISTSPAHRLEIVHTTNLENLTFDIYWTDCEQNENIDQALVNDNKLKGSYRNAKDTDNHLAKEDKLQNYQDGDTIEVHAYPLYWLADNIGDKTLIADSDINEVTIDVKSTVEKKYDPAKQMYRNYYTTKYYLVISWIETGKETDLFYIIAQNILVGEKN